MNMSLKGVQRRIKVETFCWKPIGKIFGGGYGFRPEIRRNMSFQVKFYFTAQIHHFAEEYGDK